jgi:hypothetical protein
MLYQNLLSTLKCWTPIKGNKFSGNKHCFCFVFVFSSFPTCRYSLAEAEHPPVQTTALPAAVPEQTDYNSIAQGYMWYQNFALHFKMLDTDQRLNVTSLTCEGYSFNLVSLGMFYTLPVCNLLGITEVKGVTWSVNHNPFIGMQ